MRACSWCKADQPMAAFCGGGQGGNGRAYICRSCRRGWDRIVTALERRGRILSPGLLDTCDRSERRAELAEIGGIGGVREIRARIRRLRTAKALCRGDEIPPHVLDAVLPA
jgi:hypothetical protein